MLFPKISHHLKLRLLGCGRSGGRLLRCSRLSGWLWLNNRPGSSNDDSLGVAFNKLCRKASRDGNLITELRGNSWNATDDSRKSALRFWLCLTLGGKVGANGA